MFEEFFSLKFTFLKTNIDWAHCVVHSQFHLNFDVTDFKKIICCLYVKKIKGILRDIIW